MVRLSVLLLTPFLLALIACKSGESAITPNNEATTVTKAVKAAKESCETLNVFYLTGLNSQNEQLKETYLGSGHITLRGDALLQQYSDHAVKFPETIDYHNIFDLYSYGALTQEFSYDKIPVDMTEQEYQNLKRLKWDRYYGIRCQNINRIFN